jgi:hypothetical protein
MTAVGTHGGYDVSPLAKEREEYCEYCWRSQIIIIFYIPRMKNWELI